MSRYLDLRAALRVSTPDHPLFCPDEWIYLDPGMAFENESQLYLPSPVRESRQKVFATNQPSLGHKKQRFIRSTEDFGAGYSNWQINWAGLVVMTLKLALNVHSYFTARITLGKSNGYPIGPFLPGSQGIGFLLAHGPVNYQCAGICKNEVMDESEYLTPVGGANFYSSVFKLTVVSFGKSLGLPDKDDYPEGYVEYLVNGESRGHTTGGPKQYLNELQYPGAGFRVEITNDDASDDSGYANYTEISWNGAHILVNEPP